MKKKQGVVYLVDQYADWEGAHLSSILNEKEDWSIKIAANQEEVMSIGGFRTKVDYLVKDIPTDIQLFILVGGESWNLNDRYLVDLIAKYLENDVIVGAICGAVDYLAYNGILNNYKHTGNALMLWNDYENYKNNTNFIEVQAVQDNNLITANGTAALDFTELVLKAVGLNKKEVEQEINIEKLGYYEYSKKYGTPF